MHADTPPSALEANIAVTRGVAHSCKDSADQLRNRLMALDDRIAEILGSKWTGQAAREYGECFTEWHDGARRVEAALWRLGKLVDEAAAEYEGTDTNNASQLTIATVNLPGIEEMR